MKSRDLFLKQFLRTRQNTDWQKFKELRNTVKKKLLEAERNTLLKKLDFIRIIIARFEKSSIAPFLLKIKKYRLILKT